MAVYMVYCLYILISARLMVVANEDSENNVIVVDRVHDIQPEARQLREENDDNMPDECRTDLCRLHVTTNPVKGTLRWPQIQVGYELQQTCPWTQFSKVKVKRHCSVGDNGTVKWTFQDLEGCPDPPIKYQLKKFKREENMTEIHNPEFQAMRLHTIYVTYEKYHQTTPFNLEDIKLTLEFLGDVITVFKASSTYLSPSVAEEFLYVLDVLLRQPGKLTVLFKIYPDLAERLLVRLQELPKWLDVSNVRENFIVAGTNLFFYTEMINSSLSDKFTVNIPDPVQTNGKLYDINKIDITTQGGTGEETDIHHASVLVLEHIDIFSKILIYSHTMIKDAEMSTQSHTGSLYDNQSEFASLSEIKDSLFDLSSFTIIPTYNPEFDKQTGSRIPWGPLMLIDIHRDSKANVTYTIKNIESSTTKCAASPADNLAKWTSHLCASTLEEDTLTCHCHHALAFGAFILPPPTPKRTPAPDPVTENPIGGIDLFLGFSYTKELTIFGKIGNALSLCGLLITVVSYVAIRNARRGIPTWILIHLCLSLIMLISFTFTLDSFAHDTVGCSVANAIRYYTIFVSLLWNGIEGFNMYLMLVRVFNDTISRFKLKATVVAWGVPILMVGVCEAVNYKAFHGQYVILSLDDEGKGTCSFRCQLRTNTLLYGFVVPMSIILVHNIIIFCLVLRVIIQLGREGAISTAKKKSKQSQVVGALSILVLLGVPWLFSAFGVVDANINNHLSRLEIVIQVVFVVCISLQGLFIFFFHCVRNPDIRACWKSLLNVYIMRSPTTSSGITNGSTKSDNVDMANQLKA